MTQKRQGIGSANGYEAAKYAPECVSCLLTNKHIIFKSAQWCQVAWDDPPFNECRDYCKLIFHNLPSPSGKAQSGFAFLTPSPYLVPLTSLLS